jgi:hypothetical protein
MKRSLILIASAALALSACGYDGHYRYSCQDPENWNNEECNPPMCKVDGACYRDLIGFDPEQEQE